VVIDGVSEVSRSLTNTVPLSLVYKPREQAFTPAIMKTVVMALTIISWHRQELVKKGYLIHLESSGRRREPCFVMHIKAYNEGAE